LLGEKWVSEKANAINAYNITTKETTDTPFHFLVIKCKNYAQKQICFTGKAVSKST